MLDVMEQEIRAQPAYVRSCLPALRESLRQLDIEAARVVMAGCGDSYYSAVAAAGIYRRLSIPVVAVTAQEVAQFVALQPHDLVVLASVSGSTKRTVEAAARAREAGATTLAITCRDESALARTCDFTLLLPYEPISRSTPHTLDYTVTLLAQALVAERLGGVRLDELDGLAEALQRAIGIAFRTLRSVLVDAPVAPQVFYLGAGTDLGTAMYGAAKLHEAGGQTAFAGESENFWHGMNFMVRPTDLVVVFQNRFEPADVEQLLVAALERLAGAVVYVGSDGVTASHQLTLSPVSEVLSPFVMAIAPQVACLLLTGRGPSAHVGGPRVDEFARQLRVQAEWFER